MLSGPGEEAAAATIHAAYALPVRYTGAGVTDESIPAVFSDSPADPFQGPGSTAREVSFEIRFPSLPGTPRNDDLIVDEDGSGATWRVIDITRRADIGAWVFVVEAV